jgi:eukaryotic-like serine/threonine-protein kinase
VKKYHPKSHSGWRPHLGKRNPTPPSFEALSPDDVRPFQEGSVRDRSGVVLVSESDESVRIAAAIADSDALLPDATMVPTSVDAPAAAAVMRGVGIGDVLDKRYRVESVIGEGAMGIVYRCHHELLHRPVALKVLRPEFARERDMVERFLNEARAASAGGSPHVVQTFDIGALPNGSVYFVMEYLEGQTLGDLIERAAPLPVEDALGIARQIALGLGAAHAAGVVHRDLKPDNVLLIASQPNTLPHVKILDFGIAKVARSNAQLTHAGTVFGTPRYMAPEQAQGLDIDGRADLYSLGIVLFEMLSKTVPFASHDSLAVMACHIGKAPPLLSTLRPPFTVRPELDAFVSRALSKDPALRFSSSAEFVAELDALQLQLQEPPIVEVARTTFHDDARPLRLRSRALAACGALLLGAAAFGGWRLVGGRSPDNDAGDQPNAPSALQTATAPLGPAAPLDPPSEVVEEHRVHFVLFPIDAHVFLGDEDLGPMPVSVAVPQGQRLGMSVRRPGFSTHRFLVDDRTPARLVISLVQAPKVASPPSSATP